jgi:hypothetical protein
VGDHDATGSLHRFDDRLQVEWCERPWIDDLCLDPLLRQLLRRHQRLAHEP